MQLCDTVINRFYYYKWAKHWTHNRVNINMQNDYLIKAFDVDALSVNANNFIRESLRKWRTSVSNLPDEHPLKQKELTTHNVELNGRCDQLYKMEQAGSKITSKLIADKYDIPSGSRGIANNLLCTYNIWKEHFFGG